MDKPTCRFCGKKHWSNEPHDFEGKNSVQEVQQVGESVSPPGKPKAPVAKHEGQQTKAVRNRASVGATLEGDEKNGLSADACPACGSTPQIFADAQKWANVRDKQRERMRKKRERS